MVAYFASAARFAKGGLSDLMETVFNNKPIINDEIKWLGPMTLGWWRYANRKQKAG
jgi:methionine synthase II (cobalamin-independent)